jgi:hypothetical protein
LNWLAQSENKITSFAVKLETEAETGLQAI